VNIVIGYERAEKTCGQELYQYLSACGYEISMMALDAVSEKNGYRENLDRLYEEIEKGNSVCGIVLYSTYLHLAIGVQRILCLNSSSCISEFQKNMISCWIAEGKDKLEKNLEPQQIVEKLLYIKKQYAMLV
jgi:ribose 5-phosphate isomerase RpiB